MLPLSKLSAAPISFLITLIPEEPIYSAVAEASLAISNRFKNKNIIDNIGFPTHLTLYIGGTDECGLFSIEQALTEFNFQSVKCTGIGLHADHGFISIDIAPIPMRKLQSDILQILEPIFMAQTFIRPHFLEKWSNLQPNQQERTARYGTYKTGDEFHPHISIAHVPYGNEADAYRIAHTYIRVPIQISFYTLQLVNIGHENEKWQVKRSYRPSMSR